MKKSGDRVIGTSGQRRIAATASAFHAERIPTPVILSEAPRQTFPRVAEWRGVEGSLYSFISRCGIKVFSRELPEESVFRPASSGSFDSPSQMLGLAQDDSGRKHRLQKGSVLVWKPLCGVFRTVLATLREIFDENAYDRFLVRTCAARSVESYREFLHEREAVILRKPRCC